MTSTIQTLPNRVGSGSAQMGSTAGTDTNDPVRLPHTGEHYVWLPEVASNTISIDTGTLGLGSTFAFEMDFVWRVPAATGTLFSQFLETGNKRSFILQVLTSGVIQLLVSEDGASTTTIHDWNSAEHGMVPGTRYTVRIEASAGDAELFVNGISKGVDSRVYASLFNADTTVVIAGIRNPAVGSGPTTAWYRLRIWAGATLKLDVNPSVDINTAGNPNAGQSSFTATTGQTVTVNRSATGLKTAVVTRPVMLLDGTDDYVQLPASDTPTFTATTGKHTVVVMFRSHASATDRLYSSETASSIGLALFQEGTNILARSGGSVTLADARIPSVVAAGELVVAAAIVDNGSLYAYKNGAGLTAPTSLAGVGTITFLDPKLGRGAWLGAAQYEGELFACLTFKDQALTVTDLDTIADTLRSGAYA